MISRVFIIESDFSQADIDFNLCQVLVTPKIAFHLHTRQLSIECSQSITRLGRSKSLMERN